MRRTALLLLALTSCRSLLSPFGPARPAVRPRRAPAPRAMFSGIVEEMGTVRRLEKLLEMPLWDGSVGEGWELEV